MKHRYKCLLCGRDKFTRPHQPHYCAGGYRKHGIKSIKIETMKNEKLGQDPAHPCEVTANENGSFSAKQTGNYTYLSPGMSKRFYAACAAMEGILSNPNNSSLTVEQMAGCAYESADELLKQEDK